MMNKDRVKGASPCPVSRLRANSLKWSRWFLVPQQRPCVAPQQPNHVWNANDWKPPAVCCSVLINVQVCEASWWDRERHTEEAVWSPARWEHRPAVDAEAWTPPISAVAHASYSRSSASHQSAWELPSTSHGQRFHGRQREKRLGGTWLKESSHTADVSSTLYHRLRIAFRQTETKSCNKSVLKWPRSLLAALENTTTSRRVAWKPHFLY